MQPQDKDIESLNKFWHWADHERPDRDLFDKKATAGGPLTEEAQEAMQSAVEIVGLRAPDCLHPSGEVLRPAIKAVSFAIMYAWKMLRENPMIQKAIDEQETRDRTGTTPALLQLPASPKWKDAEPNVYPDHAKDAVGYNMRLPGEYRERIEEGMRKEAQIKGLSHHYSGQAVEPAGDYAKCESECNRILNLLGVSDVEVTVDKTDGHVKFYHTIYTSITYTLNYAATVSTKSVEDAVSCLRKAALEEDRRRAF